MNLQLYLVIEFPVLLLYFLPADDTCLPFICLLKRDIMKSYLVATVKVYLHMLQRNKTLKSS